MPKNVETNRNGTKSTMEISNAPQQNSNCKKRPREYDEEFWEDYTKVREGKTSTMVSWCTEGKMPTQLQEALIDHAVHNSDCYQFKYRGYWFEIRSLHLLNWQCNVFWPDDHPDRSKSEPHLNLIYQVHCGIMENQHRFVVFDTATPTDYCPLREYAEQNDERGLPYRSFCYTKRQAEHLVDQMVLMENEEPKMSDPFVQNLGDELGRRGLGMCYGRENPGAH